MKYVTFWTLLDAPAFAGQVPPVTHYEAVTAPSPPPAVGDSIQLAMSPDGFDRMTVPVRLGASRFFNFLVDTGSDRTSVSRELVRELGLLERTRAQLHSATGTSTVAMAWLPELRVSQKVVRNISAPMLDASDIGADGILGIDSLRSQRIIFDFSRHRLYVLSGNGAGPSEEGAIVVRARRREGRLVITDAEVDGEKVTVVLDTGSSLTVGNLALRAELSRHGKLNSKGPTELVSVTGRGLVGEMATASTMGIGGARLEGVPIVYADAHTFRLLKLDRKPAILLGMSALRGFDEVSIDFADRTISLLLPKRRPV